MSAPEPAPTPSPSPKGPSPLVVWGKRLVSLALLAALVALVARTDGVRSLGPTLRAADPRFVLAAVAAQLGSVFLGIFRWRTLLALQGLVRPYGELARIYLVGRFVGVFTPGTTGLDVVRAVTVGTRTGEPVRAATAVVVEKVFGLFGLAAVAACALPFGAAELVGPRGPLLSVLALLGSAALMPIVLHPGLATAVVRRLPGPLRSRLLARVERLAAVRPTLGTALALAFTSTLAQALTAACYVASAWALHVPVGTAELCVVGVAIVAAMLLPISAGGAGVREGTAVVLLTRVGVPAGDALLVALLGFLATQPPALLGGLVQLLPDPYDRPRGGRAAGP